MPKFLVINQPPPHPTKRSNVSQCVNHFDLLDQTGRAEVYPIAGLKGYATFVDVASHAELAEILSGNPMGHIEQYTVIAIRELDE